MNRRLRKVEPSWPELLDRILIDLPQDVCGAFEALVGRVAQWNADEALILIERAAGVLLPLRRAHRALLLETALDLVDIPEAAVGFFCTCGEVVCSLSPVELRSWVKMGQDIGRSNHPSAEAFFRRESQAGQDSLGAIRQAVQLSDVGRRLQLYCRAVTGCEVEVKPVSEAPKGAVRQHSPYPLTDGRTVFLPAQLTRHRDREDNETEYKILAAHQAGYIEFGTFDLDVRGPAERGVPIRMPDPGASDGRVVSHFELFFNGFDHPGLARDLFFIAEDSRVDERIRRRYRGLAPDLERIMGEALRDRPHIGTLPRVEALVESLVRFSLGESPVTDGPIQADSLPARARLILSEVLVPEATVTDSAVAAHRIYDLIKDMPNVSPIANPMSDPEVEREEGGPVFPAAGGDEAGSSEGEQPYRPFKPVFFRGQTDPELAQLNLAIELLQEAVRSAEESGVPLSAEALEALLKSGVKLEISRLTAKELAENAGLFVTSLEGMIQDKIKELTEEEREQLSDEIKKAPVIQMNRPEPEAVFHYDEWDYLIGDYRPSWCRLLEIPLEEGPAGVIERINRENLGLIQAVRRQIQRIRPEMMRLVKRLPNGEDIDLDQAIEAVIDRRTGRLPSDRIYQQRERYERDVATAFLMDLSASTDERIEDVPRAESVPDETCVRGMPPPKMAAAEPDTTKRVLDVEREAVVVMAEALASMGQEFAIYGFSGYGRNNVEFFTFKDFQEDYPGKAWSRLAGIKAKSSTRMGPAIRHTLAKLARVQSRLKAMILLSDGYPQDCDYGPDRSKREYGLHDTRMALEEARRMNVHTYLVTVDQAGNDYLREMCGGRDYLVVERPSALPRVLPRVYSSITL